MKFVIGLSFGTNSSACLMCEDGLLTAISEERLSGEKNTKKFPLKALTHCVQEYNKRYGEIDFESNMVDIAVSSYEVINHRTLKYLGRLPANILAYDGDVWEKMAMYIEYHTGIPASSIRFTRVDHHTAHRLPAIYMSGFLHMDERLISVTSDGFGDGVSATIMDVDTNQVLSQVDIGCSMGLVYQFVTGALGFKEHQHEGKITGLAAFGQPKYVDGFKEFVDFDVERCMFVETHSGRFSSREISPADYNKNIHGFDRFSSLRKCIYGFINEIVSEGATREDIACSVQSYVEELTTKWISTVLELNDIDISNIVLSGGFFANVKVNHRISRLSCCLNMFVLPPMGDEGTCVGSAIYTMESLWNRVMFERSILSLSNDKLYLGKSDGEHIGMSGAAVCLGREYGKDRSFHLSNITSVDVTDTIVKALAAGKIVCISRGGHEFGPRALCNHSILYDAGKYDTNKWLNDRLNRTEFMPFAPVVADIFADDLFYDIYGVEKSLKYMTVTLPVKPEFKRDYKAACHVDDTARPQVLHEEDNSFMYGVLMGYFRMTGKKALINTSFNLHNNPIIHSDDVAISSFMKANLDVLVLDGVIIEDITEKVSEGV